MTYAAKPTRYLFFAGLLTVLLATIGISWAIDWNDWKATVTDWVGYDGGVPPYQAGPSASIVEIAPPGIRKQIIAHCEENLKKAENELKQSDTSPGRKQQLALVKRKCEALIAAAEGETDKLHQLNEDLAQEKTQAPQATSITQEEEANMKDQLARYREKIQTIYRDNQNDLEASIKTQKELRALMKDNENYLSRSGTYFQAVDFLNRRNDTFYCTDIKDLEQKAMAYAVAVQDSEKQFQQKIDLARKRLESCSDSGDVDLIKSTFQEARQLAARMEKDVQKIATLIAERNKLGQKYEATRHEYNQKAEDAYNRQVTGIKEIRDKIDNGLAALAKIEPKMRSAHQTMKDIEKDIYEDEAYYLKRYPSSKDDWSALETYAGNTINEVKGESEHNGLKNQGREYLKSINALLIYMADQKGTNLYLPGCKMDTYADRAMEEAEGLKNNALLDLVANDSLPARADACSAKIAQAAAAASQPQQPTNPVTSTPTAPSQPPPAINLLGANTTSSTPSNLAGGLRIHGKPRLISGEGATYVAKDGAGEPYLSGVTWNSSVEDVFVMGSQGTGVAFKAGTSTLIAHKDDMVAFFDVEVVASVPNLIGKDLKEAVAILERMGLKGGGKGKAANKQGRKVTGQSIAPGTLAKGDTYVVLTAGKAVAVSQADQPRDDNGQESAFSLQGSEPGNDQGSSGFSTSGGEEGTSTGPPPASGTSAGINLLGVSADGKGCSALKSEFDTAMKLEDLGWAQSLVDQGRQCAFSADGQSRIDRLKKEQALEEEKRQLEECRAAAKSFYASLNGDNLKQAEQLIPGLKNCSAYDKAVADFKQRWLDRQCAQAGQQFNALVANHQLPQAQEIIRQAKAAGCQVNDAAVNQALTKAQNEIAVENERRRQAQIKAQQEAIQRQQEEARRREQEQQQILNTMQGIAEAIRIQRGDSPNPPDPGDTPPVSQPRCEDVCVQEKVVWLNKTDGRHSLCANGVARRPGPGLPLPKCEKSVRCVKTERRCQ